MKTASREMKNSNSQQRFKSEALNLFAENVNKIAQSANYYKRLKKLDGVNLYPYGTVAGGLCIA